MLVLIFLINSLLVALVVLVHYEFLFRVTRYLPKSHLKFRYRIIFGVFTSLIAHAVEIWIFALAYYFMNRFDGFGRLAGAFNDSLLDCAYFSFTVFTTLGFGDIQPEGDIRYLTGIESLTGLVLITWTASFLFVEMQRYWDKR